MAIAIVVPFTLTMIVGKRKGIDRQAAVKEEEAPEQEVTFAAKEPENHDPADLTAYLSGKTVAIEDVPDQVFASKALGDGIAIDPTDNVLLAPADAEVSITMPDSNHAVGLRLSNGCELLLHIGLDTVGMNGDGFTCFVKEGQKVKKGDRLIEFDPDKIKAAGHPLITMLVVTEDAGFTDLSFRAGLDVKAAETPIGKIA